MAQASAAVQTSVDVSTSTALITTVNTTKSSWNTIKSLCAVKGPAVPMDALHSQRHPTERGATTCSTTVSIDTLSVMPAPA